MARDIHTLDMWAAPVAKPVLVRYEPKVGPEHDGLRHYQLEAYGAIHRSFAKHRSTMLVLATALGKTRTFASVAKHWPGRVLVLAHRGELVDQARATLEELTGEMVEIEQGQLKSYRARIVVASVQSCRPDRLARMEKLGGFTLVIADEFHHYTATTYRRALDYFKDAKVLGVTATPDRGDGKKLAQICDDVAYVMGIHEGVQDGYLVPPKGREVKVEEVNLDAVSVNAGDLAAGELDDAMLKGVEGVVRGMLHHAGERQGIIFFPGVKSAHLAAARLNAIKPGCAVSLDGETDPDVRKQVVQDFKAGWIQFLCNCQIATEGFDAPSVAVVGLARPTKSRALYAQMCLDSKTEILTRDGWRGIDDDMSDVAAFDMSDGSVRFERADIVKRDMMPGESMYGIESPGLDIRVTNLHKMVVRERKGRAHAKTTWRLEDAESAPCTFEIPVSGNQAFPGCPLSDDEIRWKRLEAFYSKAVSPLLDSMDARQFGVLIEAMWMGDGTKKAAADYEPKTLEICSSRKDALDVIQSMAVRRGWRCNVNAHGEGMWKAHLERDKHARSVCLSATDGRPTWGQLPSGAGERVWCATVSTGAIVTRRNGKVAVVGNCGRVTRVLPGTVDHIHGADGAAERRAAIAASKKPNCLLIDFTGKNTRHSLMTPEDLLGDDTEDDVKVKARELREQDENADKTVSELLTMSKLELERIAKSVRSKVRSTSREFDPFAHLGLTRSEPTKMELKYGHRPASVADRRFLERNGFKPHELDGVSRRDAARLRDTLIKRREAKLASRNQLAVLARHGAAHPDVTFEAASRGLDYLKQSGWGKSAKPDVLHEILGTGNTTDW